MTNQTQTHTAIQAHPVRTTSFVLRAIGGGLAATSFVLVNLGCGCSGDLIDREDFTWGCLVEGDVDGEQAQAEAQIDAHGTVVRLASSSSASRSATITIPHATLETLPLGELTIDANVEIVVCEGDAIGACVTVEDVILDVVDLGDGTVRASYSGTTLDRDGQAAAAEGSFVFVRGEPSSGI